MFHFEAANPRLDNLDAIDTLDTLDTIDTIDTRPASQYFVEKNWLFIIHDRNCWNWDQNQKLESFIRKEKNLSAQILHIVITFITYYSLSLQTLCGTWNNHWFHSKVFIQKCIIQVIVFMLELTEFLKNANHFYKNLKVHVQTYFIVRAVCPIIEKMTFSSVFDAMW